MGSPRHTPGPWFEDEGGICAGDRLVAQVCLPEDLQGLSDDELPDGELAMLQANASLIAAAPTLFRELSQIVDAADADWMGVGGHPGFDAARAAIARATGAA